ncbi:MAG: hypothetical protein CSA50_04795 [Gammaproteobacteria bacterium]|nr:MAG: hypothetical protein CSA50_04795 [Gammaproteobacteria bacterium]
MNQPLSEPVLAVSDVSAGPLRSGAFDLFAGDCVPVMGASGSGKSCLLRALADLMPHETCASLLGVPQQACAPYEWRRQVQLFATESQWWFSNSAMHFTTRPEPASCQRLGLSIALLQQPCYQLSSGQKQRIALLRGLQSNPLVLLLDEPTSNLDAENSGIVESFVKDYVVSRNACALWVTHDSALATRLASKQLYIAEGRVEIKFGCEKSCS